MLSIKANNANNVDGDRRTRKRCKTISIGIFKKGTRTRTLHASVHPNPVAGYRLHGNGPPKGKKSLVFQKSLFPRWRKRRLITLRNAPGCVNAKNKMLVSSVVNRLINPNGTMNKKYGWFQMPWNGHDH